MNDEFENFDKITVSVIVPDDLLMFFMHVVSELTSKNDPTPVIIMPRNRKPHERIRFLKGKGCFIGVWNDLMSKYAIVDVPNSGYSLASIENTKRGTEARFLRPPPGNIYALTSRDIIEKIDGPVIAKPDNYWNQIIPLNVSPASVSAMSFKDLTNIVNAIYRAVPDPFQGKFVLLFILFNQTFLL